MNKNALIFFAVVSSLSMTLAIIASLIFTIHGIYLIWMFPLELLIVASVGFFVCKYMIINKAQYQKIYNFYVRFNPFARFNPMAAIPNIATYRPYISLIGTSIFLFVISLLILIG